MTQKQSLNYFTFFTWLFALSVILLGAFTRLSDAGLGCPDWPGCYGQLTAPSSLSELREAANAFPNAPLDTTKARTEMTHRYFAETLGSLIVILAFTCFWKRKSLPLPVWLMPLLVVLVIFQGLLGMWTVTLRLLPLAVMGHLLGGFATLSLLWLSWLFLRFERTPLVNSQDVSLLKQHRTFAYLTLAMVIFQIFLGGWTSANYAALICPDFPTCQGQWWPSFHFSRAFNLLGGMGLDNPLAYMDAIDRTAIHSMHRLGALLTFIVGTTLSLRLYQVARKIKSPRMKTVFLRLSLVILSLLFIQISLGIANIVFSLPLPIAVAHNGIGALLLLSVVTSVFFLSFTNEIK